jgi:hypothetical protein
MLGSQSYCRTLLLLLTTTCSYHAYTLNVCFQHCAILARHHCSLGDATLPVLQCTLSLPDMPAHHASDPHCR